MSTKKQKTRHHGPFDFVQGKQFIHMNVQCDEDGCLPPFGSDTQEHNMLKPKAPSRGDKGHTLAIVAGCARKKSLRFRQYMTEHLKANPRARILLLSANIVYGSNLAHELESMFDVGFYRDLKKEELASHQVVVCSLESLHYIDRQRFDVVLVDEIRHISNLVGGATMNYSFGNLKILRELWKHTPYRVICDADLLYKTSDTEPRSARNGRHLSRTKVN